MVVNREILSLHKELDNDGYSGTERVYIDLNNINFCTVNEGIYGAQATFNMLNGVVILVKRGQDQSSLLPSLDEIIHVFMSGQLRELGWETDIAVEELEIKDLSPEAQAKIQ